MTQWIVRDGLLKERFVVIDIGCQGGEHPRWRFLGDYAEVHGFDAIAEVIENLRETSAQLPHRYFWNVALGNENGTREFFVKSDSYGSSFYATNVPATSVPADGIRRGTRIVEIRTLDSIFREGNLPRADYIKLDCEGFEPEILKGAASYIAASAPLCITVESTFAVSPEHPHGHFHAINELLVQNHLLVFDVNIVRAPRPAYVDASRRAGIEERDLPPIRLLVGAPTTCDFLFCRDLTAERAHPENFIAPRPPPPTADQIIKAMINFELHGLMDCAVDVAAAFRSELEGRFDVDKAISLLLRPAQNPRNTADVALCMNRIGALEREVRERVISEVTLAQVYGSTSWRVTKPLRLARTALRRTFGW
jgi:FkbM family methyltransferase